MRKVDGSDELENPGDFYFTELETRGDPVRGRATVILYCPFCCSGMAIGTGNKYEYRQTWWGSLWGKPPVLTITNMLQCPYNSAHKFKIKKGRVTVVK